MEIQKVIDYLNKTYGYSLSNSFYEHIGKWADWWKGKHKPFHTYKEMAYNKRFIERDMFTLRMAKKVCEDWAGLLLNEKTSLTTEDNNCNEFLESVFNDTYFWTNANKLIEETFALGTGAFVLRKAGESIDIEYVTADCIIPLSFQHDKITEVAFASSFKKRGKDYIYLEMHLQNEAGNYEIHNQCFEADSFKPVDGVLDDVIPEYDTGADFPWFTIIRPNIINNIEPQSPMGISVFANCIDVLKGVDLAYNNFCRDFKLGGKKVFLDQTLVQVDGNGNRIAPDDIMQQLFTTVGDENIPKDGDALIHEFNPSLRVGENSEGVQAQLNYLSSKCGFGERYYNFNQGSVATATQIISENSTLFRNVKKHEVLIEAALKQLVRAILILGGHNPDVDITVLFDDSIIEDKETEKQRDMQEIAAGIMEPWEYRVKWYGEEEEIAKAAIPDVVETFDGDE